MKKNWFRLLAGVLALAMLLSLAACGGKGNEGSSSASDNSQMGHVAAGGNSQESSPADNTSSEDSATEDSTAGPADGEKYASIQAFLDDPAVSSQIDAMVEAMASSGDINISVTAEGSKLVYTFTFAEFPEGTDMDDIAAQLEQGMSDQAYVFEDIASQLKDVVDEANPTVVVSYNTADGKSIFSQEFTGQ